MALRPGSQTQHLFTNQTLRFFGKYSYGIYIFHYSVQEALTGPIRLYIDNHLHSKALAVLGGAIVVTAVTIPLVRFSAITFTKRPSSGSNGTSAITSSPKRPAHSTQTDKSRPLRQTPFAYKPITCIVHFKSL